jgi:hypothetical protein
MARFGDRTKYGKRHKPGEMNKTEQAYADMLQARKLAGEIIEWQFEAVTFKLAADVRYSPDFCIVLSDHTIEFIDTKGGGPQDPKSRVKIRCAAEKFPWFAFAIEQKQAKSKGGAWIREDF